MHGFEVAGSGLSIRPYNLANFPPIITVDSFSLHANFINLLRPRRSVRLVRVVGLNITIPPKSARTPTGDNMKRATGAGNAKFAVDAIICDNASLTILTDKPGKTPLHFDIYHVKLTTPVGGGPMHYEAALTNPQPRGTIHATGTFGPWNASDPRETNVTGDYTFDNADLGTIKGIAGILNATGKFFGPLNYITTDGVANVPDFRLSTSGHPISLHTQYHAIVDGTNGDTYLQPVNGQFLHTSLTASGKIVNVTGIGKDISLDIVMNKARMEDVLRLALHTNPPIMTGDLRVHAHLHIPPTQGVPVPQKMELQGTFAANNVRFTDPNTDKKIDEISLRTQGHPQQADAIAKQSGPDNVDYTAAFSGNFALAHGTVTLSPAEFDVPGFTAQVSGHYTLTGEQFDFHGVVRMQAKLSQMVTGWKSWALKLADPIFKKNGAGAEIPFRISGTKDSPRIGFDFGHNSQAQSNASQ
jgi:hypothetical protein